MENMQGPSQMEILWFKFRLDGKMMLQIYKKFYSSSDKSLDFLTQLVLQVSVAWVTARLKHVPLKKKITIKSHMSNTSRCHCIYI